jgi:flagellar protein FliO/FliZ
MRIALTTFLLMLSLQAFAKEATGTDTSAEAKAESTVVTSATEVSNATKPADEAKAKEEVASKESVVKDVAANKKESEIPLNLDSPKKSADDGHPFFKFLLAVSLMGVVGTGAFFFIRKYSKNNFAINKHNQIKVLTQHYLGPKKSLAIIRVAGESILIGVTEQNISMIKSLSLLDDEVPNETPQEFSGLIQQSEEENPPDTVQFRVDSEEDEFSIRGIKDVVSKRLKGMRSFQ